MFGVDFDHGQIGFPIAADDFGHIDFVIVLKFDGHLVRAVDDVIVGDDQAIRRDDDRKSVV